ncbi:MAG: potassium transporter TrkA [archaeon]|nr:potassium transporter TrkA [archaeon]
MSDNSGEYLSLDSINMTVREILTEMKDKSEVIVDLAYASLMYDSRDMADKVSEIKDDIEDLKYAIRVKTLVAARTIDDAKQLSGILQVASAADRISQSAGEIVKLLDIPAEKRLFINNIIKEADEKFRRIRILNGSDMVGNTIGKLAIESLTSARVIAIKNRHGWIYDPGGDIKIHAGDDIIVRGFDDGFDRLVEYANGKKPWEFSKDSEADE